MFLRSTLEKRLPVADGEARLSDRARQTVFYGGYLFPRPIADIQHVERPAADSTTNPYLLVVQRPVRSKSLKEIDPRKAAGNMWPEPRQDVAEEMASEAKLNRANRIERVARRIKGATIGVCVVGILVLTQTTESQSSASTARDPEPEVPKQVDYNLPDCMDWKDTDARIHAANPVALDQLKMRGEQLCELEGKPYVLKIQY